MSENCQEIPTQVTISASPHTSLSQVNFPDNYDAYIVVHLQIKLFRFPFALLGLNLGPCTS